MMYMFHCVVTCMLLICRAKEISAPPCKSPLDPLLHHPAWSILSAPDGRLVDRFKSYLLEPLDHQRSSHATIVPESENHPIVLAETAKQPMADPYAPTKDFTSPQGLAFPFSLSVHRFCVCLSLYLSLPLTISGPRMVLWFRSPSLYQQIH